MEGRRLILPSDFLTSLPFGLRTSHEIASTFSVLRFRSENCIVKSGASPPRLSAITKRAGDQLPAPPRRGFRCPILAAADLPCLSVTNLRTNCRGFVISTEVAILKNIGSYRRRKSARYAVLLNSGDEVKTGNLKINPALIQHARPSVLCKHEIIRERLCV